MFSSATNKHLSTILCLCNVLAMLYIGPSDVHLLSISFCCYIHLLNWLLYFPSATLAPPVCKQPSIAGNNQRFMGFCKQHGGPLTDFQYNKLGRWGCWRLSPHPTRQEVGQGVILGGPKSGIVYPTHCTQQNQNHTIRLAFGLGNQVSVLP